MRDPAPAAPDMSSGLTSLSLSARSPYHKGDRLEVLPSPLRVMLFPLTDALAARRLSSGLALLPGRDDSLVCHPARLQPDGPHSVRRPPCSGSC